jgi:glutathionylspermidine amidase/synthetase
MSKGSTSSDAPFGTLLGYAPGGVAIYSSNYSSLNPQDYPDDATFRSYIGNEYMGHKWQCVEFARRFLFLTYGFVFTDVGMAYEIFSLRFLREVVNDNILPLQAFANGSRRPPLAGSLLIWQKGGEFKHTGHVAVITQLVGNKVVSPSRTSFTAAAAGPAVDPRADAGSQNGRYTIKDTFADTEILGWMIQTADTEHSLPQPVLPGEAMAIKGARLPNKGQFRGNWLNEKDSLQKAYVEANGHVINKDPYQYFTITESAEQELIKATNELHLMYLHATDKVMKDDTCWRCSIFRKFSGRVCASRGSAVAII